MSNPFSTAFGLEPNNFIKRVDESNKIISEFSSDNPPNYVYFLLGLEDLVKQFYYPLFIMNLKEKEVALI